jgi:hypothetical protein
MTEYVDIVGLVHTCTQLIDDRFVQVTACGIGFVVKKTNGTWLRGAWVPAPPTCFRCVARAR